MTKKKILLPLLAALMLACAGDSGPRTGIDIGQDTITTICEKAIVPAIKAKISEDSWVQLKQACATGGKASLAAQDAFDMYEAVPEDQKDAWFKQANLSLEVVKALLPQIITLSGVE